MKIDELLKELQEMDASGDLKTSQSDYVNSVSEYYELTGYVTPKQLEAIQRIYDEVT